MNNTIGWYGGVIYDKYGNDYDPEELFVEWLDGQDWVSVAGNEFAPSDVLKTMDGRAYKQARLAFLGDLMESGDYTDEPPTKRYMVRIANGPGYEDGESDVVGNLVLEDGETGEWLMDVTEEPYYQRDEDITLKEIINITSEFFRGTGQRVFEVSLGRNESSGELEWAVEVLL